MDIVTREYRIPYGSGGWIEGYDEHEQTMYQFRSIDGQWSITMYKPIFKISEFRQRFGAYPKDVRRALGGLKNEELIELFDLKPHIMP